MCRGQHAAVFDICSDLFVQVCICAYGAVSGEAGREVILNGPKILGRIVRRETAYPRIGSPADNVS